jgi:hypothetical protein
VLATCISGFEVKYGVRKILLKNIFFINLLIFLMLQVNSIRDSSFEFELIQNKIDYYKKRYFNNNKNSLKF